MKKIDRAKIGRRLKQTNRRVWKLRIIQHITRRGTCWESMPNIARCLRIGKKRLTKYLDELRAAGKIKTTYRVRATQIHEVQWRHQIPYPSMLDDAGFTPKQANALTVLFKYCDIAMKDIGQQSLCSPNTARRAIWRAARLGLLRIHRNPGFCHSFSWIGKVVRCLGKRSTKVFQRPLSKITLVKDVCRSKALGCGKSSAINGTIIRSDTLNEPELVPQ